VCRSKHVEQLRNIGIINATTRSHLVGYFYTIYIMMHGSMNIKTIYVSLVLPKMAYSSHYLLILHILHCSKSWNHLALKYSRRGYLSSTDETLRHLLGITKLDKEKKYKYSKTCLKRNAIVPVFFSRFHRFPFYKGLCFNKTKYKKI